MDLRISAFRRTLAITSIYLAVAAVVLDAAMFNSALPIVARALEVEAADVILVVNGYQVVILVTLLFFSAIAERLGTKRVFITGLLIFIIASLACSQSCSFLELAMGRGLLGIGASALTSINLAMIRGLYPSYLAGRAFGFSACVVALSMSAGPVLASTVLDARSWTYLFSINLPIAILALVLASWAIPSTKPGLQSLSAFWKLLCIPAFSRALAVSILAYISQGMSFTALPFVLFFSLSKSMAELGFVMMLWSLMAAVTAPMAARFSENAYPWLLRLGLVLMSIGQGFIAFLPPHATLAHVAWCIALASVGFGFFQAPNICILLSRVPESLIRSASGMIATSRMLGQLVGSAIVTIFFYVWDQGAPLIALGVACGLSALACGQSFFNAGKS